MFFYDARGEGGIWIPRVEKHFTLILMKKSIIRAGIYVLFAALAFYPTMLNGQAPSATDPYVPLSVEEKAKVFGHRIIAPSSLAKTAFTSGINQWRDSPPEWGQGMAGYGRRYGSKTGTRAAQNAIGFVTAAALHQDPRYFRSAETGFLRRTQYAVKATFVTRNDSGQNQIAIWKIVGNYGGQAVSNIWKPDRYHDVPDTLFQGSLSMGYDAASNLLQEFWPDIRQRILRR